ncbi:structural, N4 gp59-like protein [Roseovarius Plymouth podovirus 1]|uniref:Structural, N4 gp59-like protein n=1 Tax=Roseovarius Plymouth podovirus 1 TaxID=926474 RepID=K4Q4Z2_9CAUD|nr:portal protein [Roseovarius Plymouth podovirus 1]CBX88001.1 structural, N4 gp59-like protein [Roseovarius Plymouth podovirus 1]
MMNDENTYKQSENRNESAVNKGVDPENLDEAIMEESTQGESKSSLTEWPKEPTLEDLRQDLEFARQETNDQKSNVDGWLDLRNATGAEAPKKAKPGRSAVQPKLIRKHNEWRYPALSEPFLNTDRMFEVLPRTHEDAPKAKQNQILLNWQWDTKINKTDFIDRYVRTAVDEGSVVVRVGWEQEYRKETVETTNFNFYPVQSEEEAQMVQQAMQMMQAEVADWESLPESLKAAAEKSAEIGQPVTAEPDGVVETVEERMVKNCPSVRIVNIANLFVDPSCEGDWEQSQYMVYTYEATKSELMAKKGTYQNLENVNWESAKIQSNAGNPDHESNTPNNDMRTSGTGATDKQKVLVYEYWGLYDIYDNGIMVPIVVTWVGETIIEMRENPFPDKRPPFVIVPYMPILKSVFGEADASLLQDNQRIIGAVTRGVIDLMGRSANAQTGYAKGFLDPVNKRRFVNGEDFEFNPNGDPKANIRQMEYPEIPRSAHETIQMQNAEAEALTGVKSFSGGISGDAYGSVATGIRGALDSAATREMSILRRLAKGMQAIGTKMIAMNAKFLSEKEIVRVTNEEFVEVSREELMGNFDLKVDISTASVDEQRATDLGMVLQTVGPDMDPSLRQIILAKIADLKRMPDLAEQLRSYQPQPDPMQVAMAEAELKKVEGEIVLDAARAEEARARAAKLLEEADDLMSGMKHERDVEKMGAQAAGNRSLEITKALLNGETPSGMIEAAVGYNKVQEAEGKRNTFSPVNNPISSGPAPGTGPSGAPALGSGFSDPSMVPPQLDQQAGQRVPIGPLSTQ